MTDRDQPLFTQDQIREQAVARESISRAIQDPNPLDRARFEEERVEYLLDSWVALPAEDRADIYTGLKITVDEVGVEALEDFEIGRAHV